MRPRKRGAYAPVATSWRRLGTRPGRTDDHALVNPFASYRRKLFGRTWTLQLNVNNVFDLRSDQGNNWTWPRFTDPRQYSTTLSVDW